MPKLAPALRNYLMWQLRSQLTKALDDLELSVDWQNSATAPVDLANTAQHAAASAIAALDRYVNGKPPGA